LNGGALRPVELLSVAHSLDRFDSGVGDLDRWLRKTVVGYYALAMSAVAHSGAPSRLRRGMPDPVPVVLLARLAIDRGEHGQRLGGHLLVDALRRCVRGGREFGARAVVVDAIDERAAGFYRHFDFHDLDQGRLWRRISDITAALAAGE
jgi:predicted N-acetyltransferase YhbS